MASSNRFGVYLEFLHTLLFLQKSTLIRHVVGQFPSQREIKIIVFSVFVFSVF